MNKPAPSPAVKTALRNGDVSLACEILESRLKLEDSFPAAGVERSEAIETRQLLAELYLRQGKASAAKHLIDELLEEIPDLLSARILAAHIIRLEGQTKVPVELYSQLVKATEIDQEQLKFIASELVALGAFEQVVQTLLRVEPMDAQSFYHLGLSYFRLGQIGKALPIYRKLFASIPDNPTIARELSLVAAKFREFKTAIEAYSRYMELIDPSAADFVKFSDLQLMSHNVTDSQRLLEKALALGEDSAESRLLEAKIARLAGDYTKALERAHATLALSAASGTAWSIVAELTEAASVDAHLIDRLTQVIAGAALPPHDLELAQFALAGLHAKVGDITTAYGYIRAANQTKSTLLRDSGALYNRQTMEELLHTARQVFTGRLSPKVSTDSHRPVFIVGMPRSGTTVIHRLLEASGELQCLGESEALPFVYAQLQQRLGQMPEKFAHQLKEDDWNQLAAEYLRRAGAGVEGRDLADKMPHNFLYVGMILSMFPQARIVQLRRAPFNVCMSIYAKPFPEGHSYACNPGDLAHFYYHCNALMDYWSEVFPNQTYNLDFDRFLDAPTDYARQLFEFLGYPWEDKYLEARTDSPQTFTFSELQVRKPIRKSEADKWEQYRKVATDLLHDLETWADKSCTDGNANTGGGS
ncbi:tetratricopeptide repeat-containing sulfotransferase family protein [Microbulbifer guangxiensis]|uniref:tetratricopeptide repeat-containing sulfotransferase family protein n=1 Tax=Microbulbifer guangxiensis TaxID=2904249 RepID=UPI001F3464B5|nr:tetratricopeptide repeat-containing sulfotransferase family protein [Microbulbifer guangxiensis]